MGHLISAFFALAFLASVSSAHLVGEAAAVQNLPLLIAFLGGVLSFFATCSIPLILSFFVYTFKEKKRVTLMSLVFFVGFGLVFSFMAVGSSSIGAWLNINQYTLIPVIGVLFVSLGIASVLGLKLPAPQIKKFPATFAGTLLFGMAFGIGFVGCGGPVLLAALTYTATLPAAEAVFFMFIYSIGLGVPLVLFAYLFEKRPFAVIMKTRKFSIGKREFYTSTANIAGGAVLIFTGVAYILVKTSAALGISLGMLTDIGTNVQSYLLELEMPYANVILLILLGGIILFATRSIWYSRRKNKNGRRKQARGK